jgi:hypothetical protein
MGPGGKRALGVEAAQCIGCDRIYWSLTCRRFQVIEQLLAVVAD